MPIRPELKIFYATAQWKETRLRVLKRAGGAFNEKGQYLGGARCEQCHAPDRKVLQRVSGWWLDPVSNLWRSPRGNESISRAEFEQYIGGYFVGIARPQWRRIVRIVITCAHLNHTPGDDREENVKALCNWCHLNWDRLHHKETRCQRKDAARPLLVQEGQHAG